MIPNNPQIKRSIRSIINPIDKDKNEDEDENEDEKNNELDPTNGIKIGFKTIKNRNLQERGTQEKPKMREFQENVRAARTDRLLLTVLTRAVDDSGWVEGAAETSTSTSTSILSALTPHFITIIL